MQGSHRGREGRASQVLTSRNSSFRFTCTMSDHDPPFCWSRAAQVGLTFRRITDAGPAFPRAALRLDPRRGACRYVHDRTRRRRRSSKRNSDAAARALPEILSAADWLVTMHAGEDIGRLYHRALAEPAPHHRYRLPPGVPRQGSWRAPAARPDGRGRSRRQGRLDPCREIQSGDAALPSPRICRPRKTRASTT